MTSERRATPSSTACNTIPPLMPVGYWTPMTGAVLILLYDVRRGTFFWFGLTCRAGG